MAYRLAPHIECVLVKHPLTGIIRYHYQRPAPNSPDFGPFIPTTVISDEQAAMLLAENMIERIDGPDTEPAQPGQSGASTTSSPLADGPEADRVQACLDAIAALEIPLNTGAPKVRDALRQTGQTFANDLIARAVRHRKQQAGQPA